MDGTSTWVKPEREAQQLLAGENFDNACHRVSGSLSRQLRVVYAAKYQGLPSKETGGPHRPSRGSGQEADLRTWLDRMPSVRPDAFHRGDARYPCTPRRV